MSFSTIVMEYKENCKREGEIMTGYKIGRMFFADEKKQKDIALAWGCHKNTIGGIIKKFKERDDGDKIWEYLKDGHKHISEEKLVSLFSFLEHKSRKPKTTRSGIEAGSEEEKLVLDKFQEKHYGYKRMQGHLKRQGYDAKIYTLGNLKGMYRRNKLKTRKIRTKSGHRRALYDYEELGAFEILQYDTKDIADEKSLPQEIYDMFKHSKVLPQCQWTIIDVKTKTRFLAFSRTRSSFFGLKFLEFVLCHLRANGVRGKIHVQVDKGGEFFSESTRKQQDWNNRLACYDAFVYDHGGAKWKQNIVERSHRTDDEEFYCPRGERMNNVSNFFLEAQFWIVYYNNRSHSGIGMNGLSPRQKLEKLRVSNGDNICNFPCLILEDFFKPFETFFEIEEKSQNVLTHYQKPDRILSNKF